MKHFIEVKDDEEGFNITIKLEKLSPIQASSFYKAFSHYIDFINKNPEQYGLPEWEKELPELIIKEYDRSLEEHIRKSELTEQPENIDKL